MNNGFSSGCTSNTSPLEQLGLSLNSQSGGINLGMDIGQSSSSSGGNNSMNPAASMLANMAALTQPNCEYLYLLAYLLSYDDKAIKPLLRVRFGFDGHLSASPR